MKRKSLLFTAVFSILFAAEGKSQWTRIGTNTQLINLGDYVGVGNTAPTFGGNKFEVMSGGVLFQSTQGGRVRFENPNLEEGMSVHTTSNTRADFRVNGSSLKLGFHGATGVVPTSNLLYITSAGNFGVGSSTPGAKFEINSGSSGVSGLRFTQLDGGSPTVLPTGKVLTLGPAGDVILTTDQNTTYTAGTGINIVGNAINSVWSQSGVDIVNNNTGNVGLGVISPTAKLHVNGTGTFNDDLLLQDQLKIPNLQTSLVGLSDNVLLIRPNGDVYQAPYGTGANWVIGGNNSPASSFLTFGTTSLTTDIQLTVGGTQVGNMFALNKNYEYRYATTFGKLNAGYSPLHSTRIYPTVTTGSANYNNHRILSVFDAATLPAELLAIVPDTTFIKTKNTRISGLNTYVYTPDVYMYDFASFNSTGTGTGMFIMNGDADVDGNVIIANGDFVDTDLAGGGTTSASIDNTGNLIRSISDARLKTNIERIDNNLSKVLQLVPVKYNYKDIKKYGEGKTIGFIAQEVEKVLPEVVKSSADEYKLRSLNYDEIIPVLTGAIQEQQTQIENQQAQIEELKKMLASSGANGTTGSGNTTAYADTKGYLSQNVPNPFTQSTVISYQLPANTKTAGIGVYDLNGREIKLFTLGAKTTGFVTIDGGSMQPGMYVYTLLVNGMPYETKKMVLTSH